MKKNGYILFELVASMAFVLIMIVNILNVTIVFSKKMSSIYKDNNIYNTINIVSNNIATDLYTNVENVSCIGEEVSINGEIPRVNNKKLEYKGKIYENKNIEFKSIKCSEKDGYYQVNIEYNEDVINLFSLKKVSV